MIDPYGFGRASGQLCARRPLYRCSKLDIPVMRTDRAAHRRLTSGRPRSVLHVILYHVHLALQTCSVPAGTQCWALRGVVPRADARQLEPREPRPQHFFVEQGVFANV
jgi:hypothetical protein